MNLYLHRIHRCGILLIFHLFLGSELENYFLLCLYTMIRDEQFFLSFSISPMTNQTSQSSLGWWQHHSPVAARLVHVLLPPLSQWTAAWHVDPGPAWSLRAPHGACTQTEGCSRKPCWAVSLGLADFHLPEPGA